MPLNNISQICHNKDNVEYIINNIFLNIPLTNDIKLGIQIFVSTI